MHSCKRCPVKMWNKLVKEETGRVLSAWGNFKNGNKYISLRNFTKGK